MEIQAILRKLGICSTYRGYKAMVIALTLALEDEDRLNAITREIYAETARQLDSTPSAVEKNLRTVVMRAWDINRTDLERMAGYRLEAMPSVSEFLDILFNYIQRSRMRKNKKSHS
ncbi:MAG TPA: sporulation initiation factor Spo0A [Ruminococcaceae bacterium]|nr:sporulation initiation factor Spo0A [Oscillospiraceae bacterium]